MELVLLPSPLLGPEVWVPVAERLRRTGWSVRIAPIPADVATADDVVDAFLEAVPERTPVVLVAHSNAGLFVPQLVQRRTVAATVFADAALPPSEGPTALAPDAFYSFLQTLADERGVLPPWTGWWDDADVDALFPSEGVRRLVEREQARIPLAYFGSALSAPAGWTAAPAAYVSFGDTYADEQSQAERWGWPVVSLPGLHLHMLMAPDEVAAALTDVLATLGVDPSVGTVPPQPEGAPGMAGPDADLST